MTNLATVADGLMGLADRVDDMKWRSVWPSLHVIAYPVDEGYADRVGIVFAAVRTAAECSSMTYLGPVLRRHHRDRDLGRILTLAAMTIDRDEPEVRSTDKMALNPEPLAVKAIPRCRTCRMRAPWCTCMVSNYTDPAEAEGTQQ